MKKHIIFVCNGNIYRSVIAAECLRTVLNRHNLSSKFSVDSFGLQGTGGTEPPKYTRLSDYPKEWEAAKATLEKLKIDISRHRAQMISRKIMEQADLVISMDNKVHARACNSLIKQFPNHAHKIHRFSELTPDHKVVKDPAGNANKQTHARTIRRIHSSLNKKYTRLLEWLQ